MGLLREDMPGVERGTCTVCKLEERLCAYYIQWDAMLCSPLCHTVLFLGERVRSLEHEVEALKAFHQDPKPAA